MKQSLFVVDTSSVFGGRLPFVANLDVSENLSCAFASAATALQSFGLVVILALRLNQCHLRDVVPLPKRFL